MITRAQIRRQLRQNGGIMNAVPREHYGLGSFLKKAVGKIGKVAGQVIKSPIGKAALIGLGGAGLMGLGPLSGLGGIGARIGGSGIGQFFQGMGPKLFGMAQMQPGIPGTQGILGKLGLTKGGGSMMPTPLGMISSASLLGYFTQKGKTEEEAKKLAQDVYRGKGLGMDLIKADMKNYRSGALSASQAHDKGYHFLTPRNYLGAQGGRVGLYAGTQKKKKKKTESKAPGPHAKTDLELLKETYPTLFSDTTTSIEGSPGKKKYYKGKAQGGRIGFKKGTKKMSIYQEYLEDVKEGFKGTYDDYVEMYYGKAQGGRIGKYGGGMGTAMPRIPTGMPRVNAGGITELDYRQEGGFVPMGVKEKADDVPAMLSKNEFVMTADAVKGAGGGNVEKGAQRMYDTMKRLEGRVA